MVYIYPSYPELLDLCGVVACQAIEAASMSQFAGWGVMVSHRSGETEASGGWKFLYVWIVLFFLSIGSWIFQKWEANKIERRMH